MSNLPDLTLKKKKNYDTQEPTIPFSHEEREKGGQNTTYYIFLRRYTSPACAERGTSSEQRQRGVSRVPIPRLEKKKGERRGKDLTQNSEILACIYIERERERNYRGLGLG